MYFQLCAAKGCRCSLMRAPVVLSILLTDSKRQSVFEVSWKKAKMCVQQSIGESRSGLVMTEPLVKTNVQNYRVLDRSVLSEVCNSAGQLCLLEHLRVLAKHLRLVVDAQPLSGGVLNEA